MSAAQSPLPRNRDEAIEFERNGQRMKYVCFWGHTAKSETEPGPWVLSQWWPSPFTEGGVEFRTAEHYMMAHKAWLFGDNEIAEAILKAETPAEAKALGRRAAGFDQATWVAERFGIVVRGSIAKFGQDPALRAYLLATRGRVLVEASPRDLIWGIGYGPSNERAESPSQWRGQNLLGFALMAARDALAQQQESRA